MPAVQPEAMLIRSALSRDVSKTRRPTRRDSLCKNNSAADLEVLVPRYTGAWLCGHSPRAMLKLLLSITPRYTAASDFLANPLVRKNNIANKTWTLAQVFSYPTSSFPC